MQAIQTKYLPATNVRGSRIKATCDRGGITIPYPHELSGDEVHREAVRQLIAKFNAEDSVKYGPDSVTLGRGWNCEFVTGSIPDGSYVHVFVHADSKVNGPLLCAAPELLEALERLEAGVRLWMSRGVTDEDMAIARAAIAKAKGQK